MRLLQYSKIFETIQQIIKLTKIKIVVTIYQQHYFNFKACINFINTYNIFLIYPIFFKFFLKIMALQATMVLFDNSSYSINGDYHPTRWENQIDAGIILLQTKLSVNRQSSVGVGLMAGKHTQILCTPTSDPNKASTCLWGIKLGGEIRFSQSIQIAALALKHRLNTSQKQRIICFVGSPIKESVQELKILGKKLKKNSIAVDVLAFGDLSATQREKINSFISAIQLQQNSNCMYFEPPQYISSTLVGSKIFNGTGSGGEQFNQRNQQMDPEMALALKMSLQDQQKNQDNQKMIIQQSLLKPQNLIKEIENNSQIIYNQQLKAQQLKKQQLEFLRLQEIQNNKLMIEEPQPNQNLNSINDNHTLNQEQQFEQRARFLSKDEDKKKKQLASTNNTSNLPGDFSNHTISNKNPASDLFKSQKATQFMKVFEDMQKQQQQQNDNSSSKGQKDKKSKTQKHK